MKFAVPDINIEPVVWPKLTPLYLSFVLNDFINIPCDKAFNGATDAASSKEAIRVKLIKFIFIENISNIHDNIKINVLNLITAPRDNLSAK